MLLIPISLVMFLVSFLALISIFQDPGDYPSDTAFTASVLLIVCLWRIVLRFDNWGGAGLRELSSGWWSGAVLGAFIAVAALISGVAPPSPRYSAWGEFRMRFDLLALGLPLIVPLAHLGCEALFRASSDLAKVDRPNSGLPAPAQK